MGTTLERDYPRLSDEEVSKTEEKETEVQFEIISDGARQGIVSVEKREDDWYFASMDVCNSLLTSGKTDGS